eukprot:GFYU01003905.1.p1 GENE.GFYU01003905.1~~GFYU01003905.1.p1  ORF type:complete len:248 (-),score=55.79 GFYU01003905.1:96-839(-)
MHQQDPFHVVKEEVQQSVNVVNALYTRWKELVDANQYTNEEFEWTHNELQQTLRSVEWDVQDLEESISVVETNRRKFNLTEEELQERKRFVTQNKQRVQEIKTTVQNANVRQKTDRSNKDALFKKSGGHDRYHKLDDDIHNDNQRLLDSESQKQGLLVKKQDETLDLLADSVGRLGQMGREINTELKTQDRMIEEFGKDLDDTSSRMMQIQHRLDKIMGNSDKCKMCTIVGLVLVFAALTFVTFGIL